MMAERLITLSERIVIFATMLLLYSRLLNAHPR